MALEQVATSTKKTFALDECKSHMSEKSCWLIIHGKVYDVTDFLDEHPGAHCLPSQRSIDPLSNICAP